jgi:hypothetical protein
VQGRRRSLHLGPGTLEASPRWRPASAGSPGDRRDVRRPWGAGWPPNGLASDLRPDEEHGLTWTTAPLVEPLSVIGIPEAILYLSATMPVATCVVRLSEVSPDGVSALVATGVLNLTHRPSHERPARMEPGRVEEIRVSMRPAGYRFLAGHRLRVSVASAAWPVIWPSPDAAEFALWRGPGFPSRLNLPVVPPAGGPGDARVPSFKTSPPTLIEVGGLGTSDPPAWQISEIGTLVRSLAARSAAAVQASRRTSLGATPAARQTSASRRSARARTARSSASSQLASRPSTLTRG